jgi:hypothetical protein
MAVFRLCCCELQHHVDFHVIIVTVKFATYISGLTLRTLQTEVKRFFKTLETTHMTTQCHNPKDNTSNKVNK